MGSLIEELKRQEEAARASGLVFIGCHDDSLYAIKA
jgi:hypothetical protein